MAEEIRNETQLEGEQQSENQQQEENTPTVEELMAQLATERAEKEKLKTSLSNSNSEAARYKKALREKQTAEEQEAEAKREAEEQQKQYISELETFKKTAEAKARYALQGMPEELAVKAAEAEIAGDMDALATIQKQHTEMLVKQREAEWLKSRPQTQSGVDDGEEEDAFLKGFNSVGSKYTVKK